MATVDVSYGDLTDGSLADAIPDPSTVNSVDLSGNNIGPDKCVELVDRYFSHMPRLSTLDIKDNKIGPKGAHALCSALRAHCPHLVYLDLNENSILDDALYDVALLLRGSRLETLYLVTNHLTPRGIPTLCDGVYASKHLRELSLAFNMLGDVGASMLAQGLSGHPTLTHLDLSDNSVGDEGAVEIAKHLMMPGNSKLVSLNLSVNGIGDVGFTAISDALIHSRSTRLTHLDLGCNPNVSPDGLHTFVQRMNEMSRLRSLDLSSCNVLELHARAMLGALKSPQCALVTLEWVNNPDMTFETEKELYEVLEEKRSSWNGKAGNMEWIEVTMQWWAVGAVALATVALVGFGLLRSRR